MTCGRAQSSPYFVVYCRSLGGQGVHTNAGRTCVPIACLHKEIDGFLLVSCRSFEILISMSRETHSGNGSCHPGVFFTADPWTRFLLLVLSFTMSRCAVCRSQERGCATSDAHLPPFLTYKPTVDFNEIRTRLGRETLTSYFAARNGIPCRVPQ